jgi:hypothetical protein
MRKADRVALHNKRLQRAWQQLVPILEFRWHHVAQRFALVGGVTVTTPLKRDPLGGDTNVTSGGMECRSVVARNWGVSAAEQRLRFPCDDVIPSSNDAFYYGVTVDASPAILFRWLCQMRVAGYSYDWISHLGRRSPRELTPGLERLSVGQPVMTITDLVEFERGRHLTLRLRKPGIYYPPLAVSYLIVPEDENRCRLLVKCSLQFRPSLRDLVGRAIGPWLTWIMMRRQLLNLKALSERTAGDGPASSRSDPET